MSRTWTMPLLLALGLSACLSEPQPSEQICASFDNFAPVSAVLERRCGTLDCHGRLERPLRLYGWGGLRLVTPEERADPSKADPKAIAGGAGTTSQELEHNYRSVCGLEPESMADVVAGELAPEELMLLRKPLERERHKGSQLLQPGGPGAVCLQCWLRSFPKDDLACQTALKDCETAVQDFL